MAQLVWSVSRQKHGHMTRARMLEEGYSLQCSTNKAGDLCSLLTGSQHLTSSVLADTTVDTFFQGCLVIYFGQGF